MKNLKNKRTIHVFTRYFYPVIAGLEINILNTYRNFVKKGWNVTIHTTKDAPSEKNIFPREDVVEGMMIKRYRRASYALHTLNREIYKEGNLLVLHDFDISGQILIYIKTFILKLLGLKKFSLIFSSHGLFSYDARIYPNIRMKIRTFLQNSIGVYLINHCVDGIRTVSNLEKRNLVEKGVQEKLIKTITNGLEEEAFLDVEKTAGKKIKSFVGETGNYILQVGRMDRVKNYEVAIKALQKLPSNIKYVIVGGEDNIGYKKELLALIKSLELAKRVIFLGVTTGADKYYLMKHALAVVHLARSEAFGNAVHEALSQGTICIVSQNTGLTEFVKDNVNGFHVEKDDYENLAKKIMFIYKNKNSLLIKNMQKRDRKYFLDNSWSNVAKRVEKFYIDILTQKNAEEIKNTIKLKLVARKFIYSSLYFLDVFIAKKKPDIFILCYHSFAEHTWRHSINVNVFKKQLDYLVNKYSAITLEDVDLYIQGKKKINKPSFAITIDDGYQDIIKSRDLFKKLNIKPAIFLLSNIQNANRTELDTDRKFLSREEIFTLKKDGWIIGSHGATHADFFNLTDEQIEEEVVQSKKDLEKRLGIKIKYFAYPKGRYDLKILKTVRKAGYFLGLTMNDGFINRKINPLLIPRVGVDRTHSFLEFKSIMMTSSIKFRKFVKEKIGVLV